MNPVSLRRTRKRRCELSRRAGAAGRIGLLALAGAAVVVGDAHAQVFVVRPSLNAMLTYTNNAGASRDGNSDWIAEISPAVAVARHQGNVTGSLDARLRSVTYARDSDRSTTFVALQGRGQVEAVDDTLYFDLGASISRNNTSELSGRTVQDFLATDSANETRRFSLGPRLHFRVGDARGVASHLASWFDGGGATVGRTVGTTRANLADPHAFGRIGWDADYSRTDTRYDDGSDSIRSRRDARDETVRATALLTVSPQLRLRASAGRESNDYANRGSEEGSITGYGFDWVPTPRTKVSGVTEDRFFGRSYNFGVSHRRPLSSWNLSYARDISSSGASNLDAFDDPAFRSLYESLENSIPDAFERESFVRRQLGYPAIGDRDAFVTNSYFVARSLRGNMSLIGARNVLTFSLQRTERERLGDPVFQDPRDDLALFRTVDTKSASVALSHRLSPDSSVNASLLRSRSAGSGTDHDETRRTSVSLGLSTRVGARTVAAFGYRYQKASGRSDFSENVVTASVSMQF